MVKKTWILIINWRTKGSQICLKSADWNVLLEILDHFYIIFRNRTLDNTWLTTYALPRHTYTHKHTRAPFMLVHQTVMYYNSDCLACRMGIDWTLHLKYWSSLLNLSSIFFHVRAVSRRLTAREAPWKAVLSSRGLRELRIKLPILLYHIPYRTRDSSQDGKCTRRKLKQNCPAFKSQLLRPVLPCLVIIYIVLSVVSFTAFL